MNRLTRTITTAGLAFGLALLAGAAAASISVPVPWLLGAVLGSLTLGMFKRRPAFPSPLRDLAFTLLGYLIGSTANTAFFSSVGLWVPSVLVSLLLIPAITFGSAWVITRMTDLSADEAMLCSVPGSLPFVVAASEDLGLRSHIVMMFQSLRLLTLTFVLPFALSVFPVLPEGVGGEPGDGALSTGGIDAVAFGELVLLAASLAFALGCAVLARWIKVPAPMLEWLNMLGGKSVNGLPVLFPYEDSVPYHIYYKVMNAKKHGVPQNRERVFIVGIRDDKDNHFRWAKEEHLTKRLKDILQEEFVSKYLVTEEGVKNLNKNQKYNKFNPLDENSESTNTITARCNKISNDNPFIKVDLSKYYLTDTKIKYLHRGKGWNGNGKKFMSNLMPNSSYCIDSSYYKGHRCAQIVKTNNNIRRLTPRECFRLMDFPDTFTWTCSDSQAYKQAGNSIVVRCLELIIKEFNLNATL